MSGTVYIAGRVVALAPCWVGGQVDCFLGFVLAEFGCHMLGWIYHHLSATITSTSIRVVVVGSVQVAVRALVDSIPIARVLSSCGIL